MKINYKDLKISTHNPGGYVLIMHKPTGLTAECGEFFDAQKNRNKALTILQRKINKMEKT